MSRFKFMGYSLLVRKIKGKRVTVQRGGIKTVFAIKSGIRWII